jgi:hypothetical protein
VGARVTTASSAFAKTGTRVAPERTPVPTMPRGLLRLALVVVLVLAALPLASTVRDRLADARLAQLDDPTDRADPVPAPWSGSCGCGSRGDLDVRQGD